MTLRRHKPAEPWPGYRHLTPIERRSLLEQKLDECRELRDDAYAHALCAAVRNYELLTLRLRRKSSLPLRVADDGLIELKSWQRS